MVLFTDMITEVKLTRQIARRAPGRALQITVTAAAVLPGLMLRILADALTVIAAGDPVFLIVLVDDITRPVNQKGHSFPALLQIERRFKILQFLRMYRTGDRKGRKKSAQPPVLRELLKKCAVFFFTVDRDVLFQTPLPAATPTSPVPLRIYATSFFVFSPFMASAMFCSVVSAIACRASTV